MFNASTNWHKGRTEDGMSGHDQNAMSLVLKCALKEVTAAILESEEARDAAARRQDRLKEQERSLRQLIRDSA